MMSGDGSFETVLGRAYPDLPEDERYEKFNNTARSRDLAVCIYLE